MGPIALPLNQFFFFFGILGFLSHYLLIALVPVLFFPPHVTESIFEDVMFNVLFAALAFGSQLVSSALHSSFKYCSLNYRVCLLFASSFPQHCFQVLWGISFCFLPRGVPHIRFPCLPFDPISLACLCGSVATVFPSHWPQLGSPVQRTCGQAAGHWLASFILFALSLISGPSAPCSRCFPEAWGSAGERGRGGHHVGFLLQDLAPLLKC